MPRILVVDFSSVKMRHMPRNKRRNVRICDCVCIENFARQETVRNSILQRAINWRSIPFGVQNLERFELFLPINEKLSFVSVQSEENHFRMPKTRQITADKFIANSLCKLLKFDFLEVPFWSDLLQEGLDACLLYTSDAADE